MIGGVNFQPGLSNGDQQQRRATGGAPEGVQEAIKVLSLRLPKVVGARAVSPQALLGSSGSGGNPHVDSLVERVLSRLFPQGAAGGPSAPMIQSQTPGASPFAAGTTPRVIVGNPPAMPLTGGATRWPGQQSGTDADLSGGGQPPATIAPLQNTPLPSPPNITDPIFRRTRDLRQDLDWLPSPDPYPSELPLI